jgi:hypothetical protein
MDDTALFARDCADFLKKKMFTANVSPENLGLRVDAMFFLVAKNLMGTGPRLPTIEDVVMGTHGPTGGPHFELLVGVLRKLHLPASFFRDMSQS